MAKLVLVLGGVRSGKSRWAEHLASRSPPVTYLATAQAGDEEMAQRIAQHRRRRPPDWRTVEEPWDLARTVADLLTPSAGPVPGSVLIECLTLWLSNQMLGLVGVPARDNPAILGELNALVEAVGCGVGQVIVVSNEAGWGLTPPNALARRFGDLLGEANQLLAAHADDVFACLAGIPVRIK